MRSLPATDYRCKCGKLLFRGMFFAGFLSTKCLRCGRIAPVSGVRAIDDLNLYTILATTEGTVIGASHSTESITGFHADELIGQHVSILAQDLVWQKADEIVAKKINDKPYLRLDMVHKHKNGSPLCVSVCYRTYEGYDHSRLIVRFIVPANLITGDARARRDDNYRESDFVSEIDGDENILYISSGAKRLFGFYPEELIGENLRQIMPPYLKPQADISSLPTPNTGYKTVFQRKRKDGTSVRYEVCRVPIIDDLGGFVGYRSAGWEL